MVAALLHASWNAVLRGGPSDRLWTTTLMMLAIAAASAAIAPFVPFPDWQSWPYIVASGVIHIGYNLSLARTYRSGDLGETYPISRGSSPLLVTIAAAIFAHESVGYQSIAGVAMVSGGILLLAFGDRRFRAAFVPAALTTGALIAAYTVIDGMGVRLSGNNLSYCVYMFLIWSIPMPAIYLLLRAALPRYQPRAVLAALAGGLVSIVAYGIIIWAMQFEAMGVVSALRETSVVFAAIIGKLFLDEQLTRRRLAACIAIALGAALLAR